MVLEITTKIGCDNNCSYCPQGLLLSRYKGNKVMALATFIKCIYNTPDNTNIHFTGMCEPFLNEYCIHMIEAAFLLHREVLISTTLVGMKESDITRLMTLPELKALHYHAPSNLDNNIKVNAKYEQILNALIDSGLDFDVHYHGNKLNDKVRRVLRRTDKEITNFPYHSRANNVGKSKVHQDNAICTRNYRQNVLLPNGNIVLCCMDYGLEYVLGNLLTTKLEDIWKNNEGTKYELCKYCEVYGKKIEAGE